MKAQVAAAEHSSRAADTAILDEYHRLLDLKLQAAASPKDLSDLDLLETKLQAQEDAQTADFEEALEKRHQALLAKLSSLTDALRNLSPSPGQ